MERSSTLAFQLSSKLLVITLRPFFFSSRMSNRKSLYLFTPVKRCRQNDRGSYVETAGLGREEKKKRWKFDGWCLFIRERREQG